MGADLVDRLVARENHPDARVLHLYGGAWVSRGGEWIDIPEGSKRLLVFVALHRGRVSRSYAAGRLWPVGDDVRAGGNLRSALWRLNRSHLDLIEADKCTLRLRHQVTIDVDVIGAWAARLIAGVPADGDLAVAPTGADALDLLPGWYDDWVLLERERLRQRMLHALEALSRHLVRARRCAEAVEAAMTAVSAEPLRESAQRALLEAHLAEGNWVEGRRGFETYRRLLWRELRVEPGCGLTALLARHNSPSSYERNTHAAPNAPGAWTARTTTQQLASS
jgi:DNA-binding SARP family transcriptional activator